MRIFLLLLSMMLFLAACGNDSDVKQESTDAKSNSDVYANFQNIDIEILNNQAIVTGEVDVSDDTFFYQVEQNENIILEEQQVEVKGKWDEFEVTVDLKEEMVNTEEVVILKMYTKGKDGSIINPNYIPIAMNTAETKGQ